MSSFVHLHVHSHYSQLDGMSSINGLVDKALSCGMPALALTDHGNMYGIKELYDYVKTVQKKAKEKVEKAEKNLEQEGLNNEKRAQLEKEFDAAYADHQKKKAFKPILGVEAYCARRSHKFKDKSNHADRGGWHLILLAKNKKGYQNLCKLVSASWIEGHYYKPRIDKELLEKYGEGLIVSSACLGGEIPQKLLGGNARDVDNDTDSSGFDSEIVISDECKQNAKEAILWFKNLFGNDYYLELQRHKTDKQSADQNVFRYQQAVNKAIVELSITTGVKVICTNDVHFIEEEHAEAHDRLICLGTGKDLNDPRRMRYTKQEWFKTTEEMSVIFEDIPQALVNTLEIAEKVENYSIDSDALMPSFQIPASFGTENDYRQKYTEEDLRAEFNREDEQRFDKLGGYDKVLRIKFEADYLRELTLEKARSRYGDTVPPEILERIEFELETMKTMGFPGYFLIVQEFIAEARKMGVSVGPGRGSAAGSVVAYCLEITDINPLKYDLLFERFLNPDRISMPDIDIDFDDDGRAKVLDWVTKKYGREKVAHIVTYGTMATKSSIKDVARVEGLSVAVSNYLTKLIPDDLPDSLKVNVHNCIEKVPELNAARYGKTAEFTDELRREDKPEQLQNTLKYAEMLEGTVRQTGVHACGIIIGADDLTNFVPLATAKDKETGEDVLVTQYEGGKIESVGLIKMDFLGLRTLSIIKETVKNIKKSQNIDLNIDHIPMDDKKTFQLFCKGQTTGIFQFESAGMQKYMKDLQPAQFEDLIAMNALYRPGPMDYIPDFIERKQGRTPIKYDLPEMASRLKDTYGITVYQEQVMLLSRDLAGFTRGQSDELRKVMGKKIKEKLPPLHEKFMKGALANGHNKETLEKIWSDWEKFASYAFNKSHATCYAWLAYQTAYLKSHFPAEFMAANLTRNRDNISEVGKFMDECKALGINVLSPDVNESELNFTVNAAGDIRFGLGGIKGVGEGAALAIISEREKNGKYSSIFDFVERINLTTCNKKTLESLAFSGAFDSCHNLRREQLFAQVEKDGKLEYGFDENIVAYGNKFQQDKSANTVSLFGEMEDIQIVKPKLQSPPEWSNISKLNKEREYVGMYLSSHPLSHYEFELNYLCNCNTSEIKNLETLKGKSIKMGGIITDVREQTDRNGNPYGRFTIEDFNGSHEFALFRDNYIAFKNYLIKDMSIMILGKVQYRGDDWKFKPENLPKELELKIIKIDTLDRLQKDFLKQLTLTVALHSITQEFVAEFTELITVSKGGTSLYLDVRSETGIRLKLQARKHSINANQQFYKSLKKLLQRGDIETISCE